MLISLFVFVINNRGREAFWLSGLFIGFILANIGLMFYYAKMGGLIYNEEIFFFLTVNIERYIKQFIITIDNISRLLTWGRAVFLYFVLMFALYLIGILSKQRLLGILVAIFPLCHSLMTDPAVIDRLTYGQREFWFIFGNLYTITYLIISVILMLRDYFDHNIRWVKRQLRNIIVFVINMILYFVIFCQVDPMSMTYYSQNTIYNIGFKIYRLRFSITAWYLLLGLFAFFIIVGMFALFRYARVNSAENKDNIILERQMSTANLGTQVFIHGIKNQLFSERIVLRHLDQITDSSEAGSSEVKRYVKELIAINDNMTSRIEKLHQMFKHKTMSLIPCHISEIVALAVEKVENRYRDIQFEVITERDSLILADKPYLSEAIYNILDNASSAIRSSPRADCGKISIILKAEHRWGAIRIEDNGIGMNRAKIKKIFEPFYTDKNSNYNWGIGLSYVKQITQLHFGKLYLESKEGIGTIFILAFPIFQPPKPKRHTIRVWLNNVMDKAKNLLQSLQSEL